MARRPGSDRPWLPGGNPRLSALWLFPPLPPHGRSQRFKSSIARHAFISFISNLRKSATRQRRLLILKKLIEDGNITPVVGKTYPLSEVREACGGGGCYILMHIIEYR
jgi:hypothetical protein